MSKVHLWPEETRRQDGTVERALVIEAPGVPRRSLWYRTQERNRSWLPGDHDHLVMGSVFFLMQNGQDAHVHGRVSPSLLRNLIEFQAAWVDMCRGITAVEIVADEEIEATPPPNRRGAVVTFSGGVDSCFTTYRHVRREGVRFPRDVASAVMIHGFDIPLADREGFRKASEQSRRIVASLGLELMTVECNYKEIVTDFPHSHGPAMASCLALFGGGVREGLIGQTFTYGEIQHIAEGVNALTDPMLSSDAFKIIPDGAAFERADKIRALCQWDEFLQGLRVCWAGLERDRNCCVCEKCIRNILTFRALGLGLPPCFAHDVSDEQIERLKPGSGTRPFLRYGGLAELAAESGSSGPWVEVLEKRLARVRLSQQKRRMLRRIRRLPEFLAGVWSGLAK